MTKNILVLHVCYPVESLIEHRITLNVSYPSETLIINDVVLLMFLIFHRLPQMSILNFQKAGQYRQHEYYEPKIQVLSASCGAVVWGKEGESILLQSFIFFFN